jgi:hypothetical protein
MRSSRAARKEGVRVSVSCLEPGQVIDIPGIGWARIDRILDLGATRTVIIDRKRAKRNHYNMTKGTMVLVKVPGLEAVGILPMNRP